jgi:hypothetical protein
MKNNQILLAGPISVENITNHKELYDSQYTGGSIFPAVVQQSYAEE